MTLDTNNSKAVFQGNGTATVFPFDFKVWKNSQIIVNISGDDGTSMDVTANCSIALTESGGTVTYLKDGAPLPVGYTLAITRNMPFVQGVDLVSATRFDPQVIEDALDQATAERQQLAERLARAVVVESASSLTPEGLVRSIYTARDQAQTASAAAGQGAEQAAGSAGEAAASAATATEQADRAQAEADRAQTAAENAEAIAGAATETTLGGLRLATQAQAEAGDEGGAYAMTPLRVAQYMEAKFLACLRENVGEAVTEELTSSWAHTVGEFYYFRHPTLRPNFAPAQGGLISGMWQGKPITSYPIWQYLQTTEGQKLLKTEQEWQAMTRATWHTCANGTKIGWDGIGGAPFLVQDLGAGTLRMPDLRGMHMEAAGFNALDVGGVGGDVARRVTGWLWPVGIGEYSGGVCYPRPGVYGAGYGSQAANEGTGIDTARVVPTGPANAPRRWGALACVYLGTPAA